MFAVLGSEIEDLGGEIFGEPCTVRSTISSKT